MSVTAPLSSAGRSIYDLAVRLFPIPRSLTGNGVRETLRQLKQLLPELQIVEVPSGTKAFDWHVPDEWNVREAWILDAQGNKVLDFAQSNLHVVGYSEPVDRCLSLPELQEHLYSLPDQPDAIPYVTSYYQRNWGFCLTHNQRSKLPAGRYRAFINSTLEPGFLTYGELILPGSEPNEVLLSTYLCHPSLANDSLSGVCVTTFLAEWLRTQSNRRYTYRILFIPETIGAIVYLSQHLEQMRSKTVAGFTVTCVGDEGPFSFVPSRLGNTLADRVAMHVLKHHAPGFRHYSFLDRGSDERQYCSPRVDLPVVSVMRSKYRDYPEYHTSKDDLSLITPDGLGGSCEMLGKCLELLEANRVYLATTFCEPNLGKRGLFPTLSRGRPAGTRFDMLDVLSYCDGRHDLVAVADTLGLPFDRCETIVRELQAHGLVEKIGTSQCGSHL